MNATPTWGDKEPEVPGATPAQVLEHAPQVSFVMEIRRALAYPIGSPTAIANRTMLGQQAAELVSTYADEVEKWEVGNEWWLHGVMGADEAEKRSRYAWVASTIVNNMGMDLGAQTVGVHVEGFDVETIESAEALYADGDGSAMAPAHSGPAEVTLNAAQDAFEVDVNPGGEGRGTSWEIVKIVVGH